MRRKGWRWEQGEGGGCGSKADRVLANGQNGFSVGWSGRRGGAVRSAPGQVAKRRGSGAVVDRPPSRSHGALHLSPTPRASESATHLKSISIERSARSIHTGRVLPDEWSCCPFAILTLDTAKGFRFHRPIAHTGELPFSVCRVTQLRERDAAFHLSRVLLETSCPDGHAICCAFERAPRVFSVEKTAPPKLFLFYF